MMKQDLVENLKRFYPNGVDNLVVCCSQPQRALDEFKSLQCRRIFTLFPADKGNTKQSKTSPGTDVNQDIFLDLNTIKPATFFTKFVRPHGIINDAVNLLVLEINAPFDAVLPCVRHGRWFPFCELFFIVTAPDSSQAKDIAERQALDARFMRTGETSWGDDTCLSYSRGLFWQEYHKANEQRLRVEKESNKTQSKYYNLKVLHERLEHTSQAEIAELRQRLELLNAEQEKITAGLACLSQIQPREPDKQSGPGTDDKQAADLLELANKMWFAANWEELADIKIHKHHGARCYADLLLFKASAFYHLGYPEKSRRHFLLAEAKGVAQKTANSLLLSSIFSSLSKVAYLQGNKSQSQYHQHQSLQIAGALPELEKFLHTRSMFEALKTQLPELATKMVEDEITQLEENLQTDSPEAAKIAVLQSELALIRHMLIQAYTRGLHVSSNNKMPAPGVPKKVKTTSISELTQASPSQLGQDIWALQKSSFKRRGFFVEFGAADGILLSNSFLLEKEFDWAGICAEPNPEFNRDLKRNRNCIVSDACIAGQTGETVSFLLAKEYGGIEAFAGNDMHSDKRSEYKASGKTLDLETVSLNDFLKRHKAPRQIDYMSIDTEGNEWEILKNFPLADWDIRCLTIEHNDAVHKNDLRQFMAEHGYALKAVEFEDWYFKE